MRRISRILQVVRDVAVLVFSVVTVGSTLPKFYEEPVFLVVDSLGGLLLLLSVVDLILVAKNVKRKGFFYANSVIQLPVIGLFAGLFLGAFGLLFVALNIAILATLAEKKTAEELAKHPPVPITRNYRVVVGVGLLVILVSMFLPFITSGTESPSLMAGYSGIIARTGLPAITLNPLQVVGALLALFLTPAALVSGVVGVFRRRLSLVSGVCALVAGVGAVVGLGAIAGLGTHGIAVGGVVVLVGFFGVRPRR